MPGRHNQLRALEAEIGYTPAQLRSAHLARLENLIPELLPERLYTYEYIFKRIMQFDCQEGAELIPGRELQHRLGMMLRKLTLALPLVPNVEEEILPLTQAAVHCHVTPNTLKRWSSQGLPLAFWRAADGKKTFGVRGSVLKIYIAGRKTRGSSEIRRMTPAEASAIASQAAALAVEGIDASEIVKRLAEGTGFSTANIRRLLRRERALESAPERDQLHGVEWRVCEQLAKLYREGAPVERLSERCGKPVAVVYRILRTILREQALAVNINYIPNPAFAESDADAQCLGEEGLHTTPPAPTPDMMEAPESAPPYLSDLYSIPLLTREDEARLFLKYNYIKYRAAMLQERIRTRGYRHGMIDEFDEFRDAAEEVKRVLVRSNLRLVVSIAKRHVGPLANLFELVSEGNICLMRAVECYDCAREARFATYATWALNKHFARVIPEENYRLSAFVTGQQELINTVGDKRENPVERAEFVEHVRQVIMRASAHLTERERIILEQHYGTGGRNARTLEEIGASFKLTRERVRQIESRALDKLRAIISREAVGLA